jgi:hypothetical protein
MFHRIAKAPFLLNAVQMKGTGLRPSPKAKRRDKTVCSAGGSRKCVLSVPNWSQKPIRTPMSRFSSDPLPVICLGGGILPASRWWRRGVGKGWAAGRAKQCARHPSMCTDVEYTSPLSTASFEWMNPSQTRLDLHLGRAIPVQLTERWRAAPPSSEDDAAIPVPSPGLPSQSTATPSPRHAVTFCRLHGNATRRLWASRSRREFWT